MADTGGTIGGDTKPAIIQDNVPENAQVKVTAVRLITGQDVVGRMLQSDNEGFVVLDKPATFEPMVDPQTGNATISIGPYLPLCSDPDAPATFHFSHVVNMYLLSERFVGMYMKYATGLDIPAKPGLITG